jgi:ABC-type hemin transport system ATPase subunit
VLLMHDGAIAHDGIPAEVLAAEPLARIFGIRRSAEGWEQAR